MRTALNYLEAARRCEIADLGQLSATCELIRVVSELVHCLQHERGVSNQYLASKGQRNADTRLQRLQSTDSAHARLLAQLDQTTLPQPTHGGARLYTKIACALHALEALPQLRSSVTQLALSPEQNTEQYKQLVSYLLALIFEAADVAVDPDISRLLIALFHLMQGKEFAGQERATGAAAFAAGHISAEQKRSLEYLIDMQAQALQRFESFAQRLHREWKVLQASMPLAQLEAMRATLLQARGGKLSESTPQHNPSDDWFTCCSQRMDDLHHVEMHIAQLLQQLCREKTAQLQQDLQAQQQAFPEATASDAMSPLLAFSTAAAPGSLHQGEPAGAVGPHLTQAVLDMFRSQNERLQNLTGELSAVRTALEERKMIERAKGVLMMHQGLDEESAYRFLRRKAMDHNQRMVDVAQSVLALVDVLPGSSQRAKP